MFTYFHLNKFRYNKKGQLTPVYIVLIVLIIMMSMVTVNLSKVASIRTSSSNGSDAGALAAGSVMASVFNKIAYQNGELYKLYKEFYFTATVEFAIAAWNLGFAISQVSKASSEDIKAQSQASCGSCCDGTGTVACAIEDLAMAIPYLAKYKKTIIGIIITYAAFVVAQYYAYLGIRDVARKGRENAIKQGHQFNFNNSGIGSMLRGDQRDDYTHFLENISEAAEGAVLNQYTYAFQDGRGEIKRGHSVTSSVLIDPVNAFKLHVANLPTIAEIAGLIAAWILGDSALTDITSAGIALDAAAASMSTCCGCDEYPPCCEGAAAAAEGSLAAALVLMETAQTLLIAAIAVCAADYLGILSWPGREVLDDTDDSAVGLLNAICWIADIRDPNTPCNTHNRLVRVNDQQHHDGADLGLWQTRYPDTSTFSVVSFKYKGQIWEPKLEHDADIIKTDKMAGEN